MLNIRVYLIFFFVNLISGVANSTPLDGSFIAHHSCEAYTSKNRLNNPDGAILTIGSIYQVTEENKPKGSWVRVLIPTIEQPQRWIKKSCGKLNNIVRTDTLPNSGNNSEMSCSVPNTYDSNVLAITWQAGFCEHYKYSGVKGECDAMNAGELQATNLTIHGLWPNKKSCGNNYGKCSKEPLSLNPPTITKLQKWMPNFAFSSKHKFGVHEWTKHGTCQELSDDDYFLRIIRLTERFDSSTLGSYIRQNLGKTIETNKFREHLNQSLGKEVVNKMSLRCTGAGTKYLNEIRINLPKEINELGTLQDLVTGAKNNNNFKGSCPNRIYIEAPGLNS